MTVVGHDRGVGTSTSGLDSPAPVTSSGKGPIKRRRFEFLYFAVRNPKLIIGLSLVLLFVLIAFIGPLFVKHSYTAFYLPFRPPSAPYWFGTHHSCNSFPC